MIRIIIQNMGYRWASLVKKGMFGEHIYPESGRISYLAIIRSNITPFIPSVHFGIDDLNNLCMLENNILKKAIKQPISSSNTLTHLLLGIEPIAFFIFKILLKWMAKRITEISIGYKQNHELRR